MSIGYEEVLTTIIIGGIVGIPLVIIIYRVTHNSAADVPLYGSPHPGPAPAPSHPDGWYPDPSGRHAERWFRSGAWTAQVRDADGAVTDDPL